MVFRSMADGGEKLDVLELHFSQENGRCSSNIADVNSKWQSGPVFNPAVSRCRSSLEDTAVSKVNKDDFCCSSDSNNYLHLKCKLPCKFQLCGDSDTQISDIDAHNSDIDAHTCRNVYLQQKCEIPCKMHLCGDSDAQTSDIDAHDSDSDTDSPIRSHMECDSYSCLSLLNSHCNVFPHRVQDNALCGSVGGDDYFECANLGFKPTRKYSPVLVNSHLPLFKDPSKKHYLGGIPIQWNLDAWAYELFQENDSVLRNYLSKGIFHGFDIVDHVNIAPYHQKNYNSALKDEA